MSDLPPAAMRKSDYISHDASQWFNFVGFLFALRYSARVVKFAVGIVGGATGVGLIVGIAVGLAVEWIIDKAVDAAMEFASDATATPGEPEVKKGSPNVFINGLEAARGGPQGDRTCHGRIAQGSEAVTVNTRPASRVGDRTTCTGKLVPKPGLPKNVHIGGEPTEYANKFLLQQGWELVDTVRSLATDSRRMFRATRRGALRTMARTAPEVVNGVTDTIEGVEGIWNAVTAP
jgi:uncharacterized Zn-binding protein involved in type VI secretion